MTAPAAEYRGHPRGVRSCLGRPGAATAAAALLACAPCAAADEAVQTVTIVAVTPLAGGGLQRQDVPSAVQRFGAPELARRGGADLAELLQAEGQSISVQAAQGNRHQADLQFRGFTASPLMGQAQGLSVFLDGVRVNEPFGDAVNWDLLPMAALQAVQLMPGSNPVFGLNTLGGALVLRTRNGRDDPGTAVEASAGSFGRRSVQMTAGSVLGAWDRFASLELEHDGGARQHSGSRVQRGFLRLGHRGAHADTSATLQLADNRLEGAQTLPRSWLDEPRQAYTWPDLTRNRLAALSVQHVQQLRAGMSLSANAYVRRHLSRNVASNVGEEEDGPEATNERTRVNQSAHGFGLQLATDAREPGTGHRWVVGLGFDDAAARYARELQPAVFTADRGTLGTGDFERDTDAATRTRTLGLFALDTWVLSPRWTLTASARHDTTRVTIRDLSGVEPGLNGRHRFARLNPALGLNFHPAAGWNAFAHFSEGLRAPTPMELTCADPQAPCRLPNSFVADPPLKPVVARTLELGFEARSDGVQWNAALFRGTLRDDIQFIASPGGTQQGYFQNVGRTRRQGLELGLRLQGEATSLTLRYAYLDARFLTGFTEHSPWNSSADEQGRIVVPPGARLPGLARQQLKLRLQWQDERFTLGADAQALGASLSRGDENNLAEGSRVPGHALLHLDARWRVEPQVELFAHVANLFNRRVQTFGVLGRNAFTGPGRSFDLANARAEPFRGPGAPRMAWAGLRWQWQ